MAENAKPSSTRFAYIDCVRGLAAVFVLMQHTLEYAGFINVLGKGSYNLIANFGQAGVFAFFLVSGFVIPFSLERSKSARDFWIKRLLRIYPLYLFMFAMTFLVFTYVEGIPFERPLLTILGQLVFINAWVGFQDYVGGSWTLVIEFTWYVGLFIWWRLTGGIHAKKLLIVAFVTAVTVSTIAIVYPTRIPLGSLGNLLACCWGLFILEYTKGRFSLRQFWLVNGVFVLVCVFVLYVGFGLRPVARLGEMVNFPIFVASWTIGAATFFFFYLFRNSPAICNRYLVFLGSISYSVYLVHPLLLHVLSRYGVVGFPFVFIGIPATIAIATLTYRYIEQPFIRIGHGRKAAPQPNPVKA